jgi:hypothetical protein
MGKHFIDPKSSEILSVFPSTTQIALFWSKLNPKNLSCFVQPNPGVSSQTLVY